MGLDILSATAGSRAGDRVRGRQVALRPPLCRGSRDPSGAHHQATNARSHAAYRHAGCGRRRALPRHRTRGISGWIDPHDPRPARGTAGGDDLALPSDAPRRYECHGRRGRVLRKAVPLREALAPCTWMPRRSASIASRSRRASPSLPLCRCSAVRSRCRCADTAEWIRQRQRRLDRVGNVAS